MIVFFTYVLPALVGLALGLLVRDRRMLRATSGGLVLGATLVMAHGCAANGKLTPAAAAAVVDTAIADACQLEGDLPVVGQELVLLCPVQVAAADSLVADDTAQSDAGATVAAAPRRAMLRVKLARAPTRVGVLQADAGGAR